MTKRARVLVAALSLLLLTGSTTLSVAPAQAQEKVSTTSTSSTAKALTPREVRQLTQWRTSTVSFYNGYTATISDPNTCYVCNLRSGSYAAVFASTYRSLDEVEAAMQFANPAVRRTLQRVHDDVSASVQRTQDALTAEWRTR